MRSPTLNGSGWMTRKSARLPLRKPTRSTLSDAALELEPNNPLGNRGMVRREILRQVLLPHETPLFPQCLRAFFDNLKKVADLC